MEPTERQHRNGECSSDRSDMTQQGETQARPEQTQTGRRGAAPEGRLGQLLALQRLVGNKAMTGLLTKPSTAGARFTSAGTHAAPLLAVSRDTATAAGGPAPNLDHIQVAFHAVDGLYLRAVNVSLERAFNRFIELAYGSAWRLAIDTMTRALGERDVSAIKAAMEQFRATEGDALIKQLVHDRNGLETWRKIETENATGLEGEAGGQFVERVEARLLPTSALAEAKKAGKSPMKLQQIADGQIRPIIERNLSVLVLGATQAVAVWTGFPVPKKSQKGSGRREMGAAGTHLASEIAEIVVKHGSMILEVGIPVLAVAKFGLEISGILAADAEQEEWEHEIDRARDMESRAKNALIEMYDMIRDHTYRRLDVLSLLCASRAVQAHLNPDGPDKLRLERFVRDQVFGEDSPSDLSTAFSRAKVRLAEVGREYQEQLDGE